MIIKLIFYLFIAGIIIFFLIIALIMLGSAKIFFSAFKGISGRKTPADFEKERMKMEGKVNETKMSLVPWNGHTINDITNDLDYNALKWFPSKLTGYIISPNNENLIAFQRIEANDCRILAESTEFKIFLDYTYPELTVDFNGIYLGKIVNFMQIQDQDGYLIGHLDRNNPTDSYTVTFNSGKEIKIRKSRDNKGFKRNNSMRRNLSGHPAPLTVKTEQYTPYSLINVRSHDLDSEELKWVAAIAIFESVNYSYTFD
ncbi:hypothetical protein SAMN05443633_10797 [Chryseobacterium arachidis]|uniref:Uncharacterized protein n=2 Tax=Chryseobacterium arachidis TaxID=1416778 RepID=A0A1M5EYE4_9FLAO|nr:hypothetical protein [Chryseobacterium arachidis]SHF84001.1 hypothetical protein SAMN05443633_10797 [Chryseobacterium arachidis]